LRRLARKAVFGLSFEPEDAWNLIPWTWMIDWFSNCGEWLEAHNNRIPCSPERVCIMTKTETVCVWIRTDSLSYTGGECYALRTTKSRALSSGSAEAWLPFISERQLSILGALHIQSYRSEYIRRI
jgi:hypothetical protein